MRLVGITGGISTGKTTLLRYISGMGYRTIDSDVVARAVVAQGTRTYRRVVEEFGEEYLDSTGEIDRVKLGTYVFSSDAGRRRLEAILHPAILRHIIVKVILYYLAGARIVFIDIPLLFECKLEKYLGTVVVVSCSEKAQVERLTARTLKKYRGAEQRRRGEAAVSMYMKVVKSQMPLAEKRRLADFVINNNYTMKRSRTEMDKVIEKVMPGTPHAFLTYFFPMALLLAALLGAARRLGKVVPK